MSVPMRFSYWLNQTLPVFLSTLIVVTNALNYTDYRLAALLNIRTTLQFPRLGHLTGGATISSGTRHIYSLAHLKSL